MTGDGSDGKGFFVIPRGLLASELFPAPGKEQLCERAIFVWILEGCRWNDSREQNALGAVVNLKRGQLTASARFLAEAWGRGNSPGYVTRYLTRMRDRGALTWDKVGGSIVITVTHYDAYQGAAESGRIAAVSAKAEGRIADTPKVRKTSVNTGQFADQGRICDTAAIQPRYSGDTNQNKETRKQGNQGSGLRPASDEPAPVPEAVQEMRPVVQLEKERDRLIWQEARTIFARVAPALPEAQQIVLMNQLVSAYGKASAAKIQAIQDLRRIEQMVAADEIAGYVAATTPKAQAAAVRAFLQGMIRRAKEAPMRRPGSVAAKKNPPMTAAQRVYAMKYGAGGAPEAQGNTIDGEWSDYGDDVREA